MTFEELHAAARQRGWMWGVEPTDWFRMEGDGGEKYTTVIWKAWVQRPDGLCEQEGPDPLVCLRLAYKAAGGAG